MRKVKLIVHETYQGNIANAAGVILVEYLYDAWGDVISITGTETSTLGAVNPIRYRGYYFDTDTEFYYLNSRYYDPEIRRFINADEYASTGQGFIGYNMYAYCLNNPVNMSDNGGNIPFFVITALAGVVLGGIIGYVTTGSLKGALTGATIGGVAGLVGGAIASKLLVGSFVAQTSTVVVAVKNILVSTGTVIASSWQEAEEMLRKAYNGISQAISTPYGRRVVDSLTGKFAREAKYGYQGLSSFIKQEILKDAYLITKGYTIEWHFYWSQISDTGGASGPLKQALQEAGIKIIEHFTR